jgi:hypothetical protein
MSRLPTPVTLVPFEQYGAYFGLLGGTLVSVPMLVDGSRDTSCDPADVTVASDSGDEAEAQRFCDTMNTAFGTRFKPSAFPGR